MIKQNFSFENHKSDNVEHVEITLLPNQFKIQPQNVRNFLYELQFKDVLF